MKLKSKILLSNKSPDGLSTVNSTKYILS